MSQWWSWLLTSIGVTGLYLAGKRSLWGWVIGFSVQFLWLGYALVSRQWGFIVSSIAYGAVNLRNLIRWHIDAKKKLTNG
jgi:hypothetical protein